MTVTRSARLVGASLCAVLALVIVVWLLRDLALFGPSLALLDYWLGAPGMPFHDVPATSLVDLLLLLAYTVTAVTATRSPLAAPAFTVVGLTTIALRLPGLWAADVEALVTALLSLGLATGLVVTAAAGRRFDGRGEPGGPGGPVRPRSGPAVAAGVLCLLGGLVVAVWELRLTTRIPSEIVIARLTGGRPLLLSVLSVPPGWLSAVLVLLLLAVACAGFARARATRPFGLLTGLLLTGYGAAGVLVVVRPGWYAATPAPPVSDTLYEVLVWYGMLAGIAVLVLLGGTWRPRPAPYHPAPGLPPAPPAHRPPGW
ncbi:hypothetical protein ABZ990_18830 [Streptomyces sp. NPDC046203]|uniref:hypothetical protein n=1 Tax=Streptomyces sp. NPDC046203 TaxID=3154602 RepID=UPI0033F33A9D